jgi:hypothetical protein
MHRPFIMYAGKNIRFGKLTQVLIAIRHPNDVQMKNMFVSWAYYWKYKSRRVEELRVSSSEG